MKRRWFLALELSKLLHMFAAEYRSDINDKITQHNEITGGKLSRTMKNARKLTDVFREHGDPFMAPEDEDEIYNLQVYSQRRLCLKKCLKTYETRLDNACLWNSPPRD